MIERIEEKVIIEPGHIKPSRDDFMVLGAFNPAAIRFGEEIYLLVRIAECPVERRKGMFPSPYVIKRESRLDVKVEWHPIPDDDPGDSRVYFIDSHRMRLSFISHLRLAKLDSTGFNLTFIDEQPGFYPEEDYEEFGIEDPRLTSIGGKTYFTYVAVSRKYGVCTALAKTSDFRQFERLGIIFPLENKDVVILPEKIGGDYVAYHRPGCGYKFEHLSMFCACSPDLVHWGNHKHLMSPRPNFWDENRIGGGTVPLKTSEGWLEIYHGVRISKKEEPVGTYRAGAVLFDLHNPAKLIARSMEPILQPEREYEVKGFVPNVIFPTACIYDTDPSKVLIYCGVADERVEVIKLSLAQILNTLEYV